MPLIASIAQGVPSAVPAMSVRTPLPIPIVPRRKNMITHLQSITTCDRSIACNSKTTILYAYFSSYAWVPLFFSRHACTTAAMFSSMHSRRRPSNFVFSPPQHACPFARWQNASTASLLKRGPFQLELEFDDEDELDLLSSFLPFFFFLHFSCSFSEASAGYSVPSP